MALVRERLKIKVCSGCVRAKVIDSYYKNRFNKDGLDNYCKICRLDYNSEWCARRKDRRFLIQWRYRNKQNKINHIA
ncbi:hypothetical protein ACFLXG_03070 [Chloroflexota bacterium]